MFDFVAHVAIFPFFVNIFSLSRTQGQSPRERGQAGRGLWAFHTPCGHRVSVSTGIFQWHVWESVHIRQKDAILLKITQMLQSETFHLTRILTHYDTAFSVV